jgi:exosome complex component RRP40
MTATTTATSVAPGGTEQICFSTVNTFVMPGDLLGTLPKLADDGSTVLTLILGEGLLQEQENLYATKAGILRHAASRKKPIHKYWIDSNHRRYVPHVEDMVVGIVASVGATQMTVDIGGAAPASLDNLAFEGASRKNRPNLKPGSLVYARVTLANKDMEPEVSCLSTSGKAEGFGALDDGYLF